jgi:AcrR family transcriptional regulator
MSTHERKTLEKEHRRQSILEAAEALMQESDYVLNMDAVAARTQLAKGTIYQYFASKEDILAALTLKSRHLLYDELDAATRDQPDPLAAVRSIVWANYDFYKKSPLHYDLVTRYEATHPTGETEELQEAMHRIRALVIGLIDKAKASGQLRTDIDTATLSLCIWGTTTGLIQLIRGRKDLIETEAQLDERKIMNLFNQVLINGVAP